jgi:hypothetical protein
MASRTGLAVAAVAVTCALGSPAIAADGVLIVERTVGGPTARTSQIHIEPQRMRSESARSDGYVIFDAARQVMWIVETDKKRFTELTKADVDRLRGQTDAAMAMVREQLKTLPAEQRAQVEAVLRAQGAASMGAAPATRTAYRRTGTDRVREWTCAKYDGLRNDQKVTEVCTVDPQALGLTAADLAVSRQLTEFLRSLMPAEADDAFRLGTPEEQGYSGVPVRRTVGRSVTEVLRVSRETFPDALFAVPPGFERQSLPDMPLANPRGR